MVLCIVFGPVVSYIPMTALVAVMITVSFATFDWHSIAPKTLRRMPAGEIAVMVITVAAVVATHNLAIGVVVGSITAMVIFAKRVAHLAEVTAVVDPEGTTVVYRVTGELFFASSNDLVSQFNYATDPDKVVIDLSAAHIWDASSVAALDAIETKYAQRGKTVEITGLNDPSADLHGKLTGAATDTARNSERTPAWPGSSRCSAVRFGGSAPAAGGRVAFGDVPGDCTGLCPSSREEAHIVLPGQRKITSAEGAPDMTRRGAAGPRF